MSLKELNKLVSKNSDLIKNPVKHLSNLLRIFGVRSDNNRLSLNWERPDPEQFKLLLKIINGLTGLDMTGRYYPNSKEWIITY
ncbi:MAG: hypothetical protein ACW981_03890 [Candidatus Hodarchaeales archaeon]